jgi:hypothetical protein
MRLAKFFAAAGFGLLVVLSAFPAAGVQDSPYKDLLGGWDVQTEDGQYTFTFTFSLVNNELQGVFGGSMGEFKMENLKVEAGKVAFLVNLNMGGQEMPINFVAQVAGESLTGQLSLQFGEANIVGKKKK